jgi:hypothetical protein
MSKPVIATVAFIACLLMIACSPVSLKKPEGFAEQRVGNEYYAISPEGTLFRARSIRNYPEKSLDFWAKAVKKHLEDEGYQFIKEEGFDALKKPGVLFQWGAPYGRDNYIYLTAIIVSGDKIGIAEAACEFSLFAGYRDSLFASIKSITIN